jgi:hypothetical protein
MKKSFLILLVLGFSTFAQAYSINMTCGEVVKARNGKILKRLEPGFWGLNAKFVLMTKFDNPIGYNIRGTSKSRYNTATFEAEEKTYTYFSLKPKYRALKKEIKNAVKKKNKDGSNLYACVGHIDVSLRYYGSHVYLSTDSVEDAMKKMIKQGARHQ